MEKLPLEVLAPYLPFGLPMVSKDQIKSRWTLTPENINHALIWWLPELIPLSKYIFPGNIFTETEKLFIWGGLSINLPFWKLMILIEQHYDVFDLISKGQAVERSDS